ARPRSRPSTKSTLRRARPEYGERRKPNSSARSPPSQAKRSSDSSPAPKGVWPRRRRSSLANGTPKANRTASSAERRRSSDSHTIAIRSGGVPLRIRPATSSATSSSVPRLPAPSRNRSAPVRARRQLLDARPGELREVADRPRERRERDPSRLVRDGHRDLGARSQRLEQRPLRGRQVLEAVREHRAAGGPRVQVGAQALHGAAA